MDLHEKAVEASKRFLKRSCGIEDDDFLEPVPDYFDIVHIEDRSIVFIKVYESKEELPNIKPNRSKCEDAAAEFLMNYFIDQEKKVNMRVRFDTISLNVLTDEQAFLAHHVNCLGNE